MCYAIDDHYDYYNASYNDPGVFVEERHVGGRYCRLGFKGVSIETAKLLPFSVRGLTDDVSF